MGLSSEVVIIIVSVITGLFTVLVGIIAAIPGFYAIHVSREKDNAAKEKDEATREQIYQEISLSLITPLKNRIDELEKKIRIMKSEFSIEKISWNARTKEQTATIADLLEMYADFMKVIEALTEQVVKLGQSPLASIESGTIKRISGHIERYKRDAESRDEE